MLNPFPEKILKLQSCELSEKDLKGDDKQRIKELK